LLLIELLSGGLDFVRKTLKPGTKTRAARRRLRSCRRPRASWFPKGQERSLAGFAAKPGLRPEAASGRACRQFRVRRDRHV
jgi:hypothetical protein